MSVKAKPHKIGFVFDDSLDKPDGVQQYILSIGSWLTSQGHDVHYLVGKTDRQDIHGVHSLSRNVAVKFNGNGMSIPLPTSRIVLRRFLADEKFDVLHVQVPYSPWLAGRLINAAGPDTAIIGTFHIVANSALVNAATRLLGLYTHSTVKKFDEIVSVSKAAQVFAKQTYGIASDIVPNSIDYRRFQSASPLKHGTDKRLTILFLGRLVPRKGCRTLLEAITSLRARHGDEMFRVLICGKGPELTDLQNYVHQHELEAVVEFMGFVSEADKPAYYASADISVFPSSGGESFGIVLVEAMASGHSAVLGGDNSGYHTVLEPQPDLLFDPHDPVGLANTIDRYLTDTVLRDAMASWGSIYAQQFDQALVGTELIKRYERALQKRQIPEIL